MDCIEEFFQWSPTPLAARAALALARVLQPLSSQQSSELHFHAYELAFAVGERAQNAEQVPALLMDDECLVQGFKDGCRQAECDAAYLKAHPPTVWFGDWTMDDDGICETRASVGKSVEGFLPGLEVSRLGGDCEASYGDPVATLDQAIEIAKAREFEWYMVNSDEA